MDDSFSSGTGFDGAEYVPYPRSFTTDAAFVMGNMAPDSGVPSEDGRHYIPDKSISHFHVRNARGFKECGLAAFTARYLSPPPSDSVARAFYLGYLAHLYTDNQWVEKIGLPARAQFAHEFKDNYADPQGRVKTDWYIMDCLYLKAHPNLASCCLYAQAPPLWFFLHSEGASF